MEVRLGERACVRRPTIALWVHLCRIVAVLIKSENAYHLLHVWANPKTGDQE